MTLPQSKKDGTEGVILDLKDLFFLPSSPSYLVSLALLNNHNIFHNNENETLFDLRTKEVLAQAQTLERQFPPSTPQPFGRSSEPSQDSR